MDESLGDDDSIGVLDSGTNREEIISLIGNKIENVDGQSVIRVQTKYYVWQSKLGLLDEGNNGSRYVTNILVQAESGSLAHDATFQTTLVDDNMSLQLVFRNEANDDLPYGTKTIFQQLITAEPDDGRTIATDFEDMMRSRSDNMTIRPVSMMIVPLPFRARTIVKKTIYPVFITGREISGLRSRCNTCNHLDTSTPRVEPVPYHYVRIQEDREDTQRYQESEFSGATFSPSYKKMNKEGQEDTNRRQAEERQMREELEEMRRAATAREERARIAEQESKERSKQASKYAKVAKAARDAALQEAEDIRRAQEHDQVVQEENFERMEADLRDKEARMRREIAKENEERIAKLVSEKMEEAMAAMNLANQQTLAAGTVSGNAEQQCILPSISTTYDTNSFTESSLASAINVGTSNPASFQAGQPQQLRAELRLLAINANEKHPLTVTNISPRKRKDRENGHKDGDNADIETSPSKYFCNDSNHLN